MTATGKLKNKLLLIDSNQEHLKLLYTLFHKIYNVKTAKSGDEALDLLKEDYKPGVIVCEQEMPNLPGSKFLEMSIKYSPDSLRILCIDYQNTKDAIARIKKSDVYVFIKKPVSELELVYALRNAFDVFNNSERVSKLNKQLLNNEVYLINALKATSALTITIDRYYFKSHSQMLATLARAVGEELKMNEQELNSLELTTLLFHLVMSRIPRQYLADEIGQLSVAERDTFFKYFKWGNDVLLKYQLLYKHGKIISQVWEKKDGKGYPKGIEGIEIAREAQIIFISNLYINGVFKIPDDKMQLKLRGSKITQENDEAKQRHGDIKKLILDNWAWFDHDVYRAFNHVIDKGTIKELESFKLEEKAEGPESGYLPGQTQFAQNQKVTFNLKEVKVVMVEKEISIDALKSGMVLGQDIYTSTGIKVFRSDSTIDDSMLSKIKSLERTGSVQRYVSVMVPSAE